MSIFVLVDVKNRSRLLQWLTDNTTITMESGAPVLPFPELRAIKRDTVVRASKKGLALIFPLSGQPPKGQQVGIRDFCEKVRKKYGIIPENKTDKPQPQERREQGELLGTQRRPHATDNS